MLLINFLSCFHKRYAVAGVFVWNSVVVPLHNTMSKVYAQVTRQERKPS